MPPLRRIRILLAAVIAVSAAAAEASATTVSVAPADTTVTVTESFAVRVVTDAFADLRGFQLVFSYDPAILQFLGADPGAVVTASGNPYVAIVLPDAAPADSIWYDVGLLGWSSSGPGILAFFRFKALTTGLSPVQCQLVQFRDSFNVATLPACQSGVVRVTGPVPSLPQTWGRMKALYR